jgi:hypothetical protein
MNIREFIKYRLDIIDRNQDNEAIAKDMNNIYVSLEEKGIHYDLIRRTINDILISNLQRLVKDLKELVKDEYEKRVD